MGLNVAANEGFAKLRWICTGDSETMISTIGIRGAGAITIPAVVLAEKVARCWTTYFTSQYLNAGWTFAGVEVWMGPAEAPSDVAEFPLYVVGAAAGAPLPTNCAALVRKRTAQGGRHNHGRMFLPAGHLTESRVDSNGMLEPSLLGQLGTALDGFQSDIEGDANGPECVLLLFHQTVGTGLADDATVITDLIAQPQIATQRRRMR